MSKVASELADESEDDILASPTMTSNANAALLTGLCDSVEVPLACHMCLY